MKTLSDLAIVLCGGEGKRLRPLTYYIPKPMIPVGSSQKPLLEYIVRHLAYYGIDDIIFLVDYKAEQITNYFEDGARFGVKIRYLKDDPQYKGTAGAVYNAYLKGLLDREHILIYYGDILSDINLRDLVNHHIKTGADATLALSPNYTLKVGVAELDGTKIRKLVEKPPLEKPVTMAILMIKSEVIPHVGDILREKEEADIMGDLIPMLIGMGRVEGYLTDAFWYDVGSLETYEKLNPELVDEIFSYLKVKKTQIIS